MKTSFQMSNKEDEIDSAGGVGLNDLVFNEENQERRSWKLWNSDHNNIISYWCVFDQACVFSSWLWRVNILVFIAFMYSWLRAS